MTISFSHNSHTLTTAADGTFAYSVNYGTSTTLTPSHPGYSGWSPATRSITAIAANTPNQDFAGTINTYTISGSVTDGSNPLAGVTISFSHNSHTETTAADGTYAYTVNYGTTTTVTPSLTGYDVFSPANRSITAIAANTPNQDFAGTINTYTITAMSGLGGSIDPVGTVSVNYGQNQAFTMTPYSGYQLLDVEVDGVSAGPLDTYEFTYVTQNHTISASYGIKRYTVTAAAGPGGRISPTSSVLDHGTRVEILIEPDPFHHLVSLRDNGREVGPGLPADQTRPYTYLIDPVTRDHQVEAAFARNIYEVTAAVRGGNGSLNPAFQTVRHGDAAIVNFSPAAGYRLAAIEDNGFFLPLDQAAAENRLILENVALHHVIYLEFVRISTDSGNDYYRVEQDSLLSVAPPGVLANDPGFRASFRAQVSSPPLHGSLELAADGGFNYLPGAGFTGLDRFTYRAVDGNASSEYQVTIEVTPLEKAIIGRDDAYYFTAGREAISVPAPGILSNDSHPQGQALFAEPVSRPETGTLSLNPDGGFSLSNLPAGFKGILRFTYRAVDARGQSSPEVPVLIGIGVGVLPPQVTILNPGNGGLVREQLAVEAEAVDDQRLDRVNLYVNDVLAASENLGRRAEQPDTGKTTAVDAIILQAPVSEALFLNSDGSSKRLAAGRLAPDPIRLPDGPALVLDDGRGGGFILSPADHLWLFEEPLSGTVLRLPRLQGDEASSFRVDARGNLFELFITGDGRAALLQRPLTDPDCINTRRIFEQPPLAWDLAADGDALFLFVDHILLLSASGRLQTHDLTDWRPAMVLGLPGARALLVESGQPGRIGLLSGGQLQSIGGWNGRPVSLVEGFGRAALLARRDEQGLLLIIDPERHSLQEIQLSAGPPEQAVFLGPNLLLVNSRSQDHESSFVQAFELTQAGWSQAETLQLPESPAALLAVPVATPQPVPATSESGLTASLERRPARNGVLAFSAETLEDRRLFTWTLDSRNWPNGLLELRVVAWDDLDLSGEDSVHVVARNLVLTISGRRLIEDLWVIRLDSLLLKLEAFNPDRLKVVSFRLEKRSQGQSAWETIRQLPGNALEEGSLEIVDDGLDPGNKYEYRLSALDAQGRLLALSNILLI